MDAGLADWQSAKWCVSFAALTVESILYKAIEGSSFLRRECLMPHISCRIESYIGSAQCAKPLMIVHNSSTHTHTKDWLWNILPFWIIEVLWPSKSPKSSIRTDSLFQSRADNSLGTCACTSPSKAACIKKNDIIDVLMMAVLKKMIQMLVWKISNVSSQIYWISITLTLNFQYIVCNQISSSTVIELPAIKFWDFWQDEASARVVGENWSTKLLPFNFTLARMPRSTASDQKLRLQQASSRKSLVTRLTGLTI